MISETNATKVIAEIGINHGGNFKKALKLIDIAKNCGADFVKFQIYKAEDLVTLNAKKARYQRKNDKSKSQYLMLKKFEFSQKIFKKLISYSKKKKIQFLATPFDLDSVDFLIKQKLNWIKVSSGDINNYPILEKIGKNKKKVFLSTGMSKMDEIRKGINILTKNGTLRKNIIIFHCTSSYPTMIKDANLNVLKTYHKKFGKNIGYSDHTQSIFVPGFASALGAKFVEKHLTLNNLDKGPDHKSSLNPKNFKRMIEILNDLKISLGSHKKKITKNERENLKYARRSIYAKRNVKVGETFSASNLITKRPFSGLSPILWKKIIGKKAKKNFFKDEAIKI